MSGLPEGASYDGNVLAGPLAEVFFTEATAALARCAGCGATTRIAELAVYGKEPGLVARCPGCTSVMLRVVETPTATWLDLSGSSVLRFPRTERV